MATMNNTNVCKHDIQVHVFPILRFPILGEQLPSSMPSPLGICHHHHHIKRARRDDIAAISATEVEWGTRLEMKTPA